MRMGIDAGRAASRNLTFFPTWSVSWARQSLRGLGGVVARNARGSSGVWRGSHPTLAASRIPPTASHRLGCGTHFCLLVLPRHRRKERHTNGAEAVLNNGAAIKLRAVLGDANAQVPGNNRAAHRTVAIVLPWMIGGRPAEYTLRNSTPRMLAAPPAHSGWTGHRTLLSRRGAGR